MSNIAQVGTTQITEANLVRKINNYYITEAVTDENGNVTSFNVLPFPKGFDPKLENQGSKLRKALIAEIKQGNPDYVGISSPTTKSMYIMFTSGSPITSELVYEKKYIAHG